MQDFWNFFDTAGLLAMIIWSSLRFVFSPHYSQTVDVIQSLTLKLAPIPLTIGLLRYFVVLKDIGEFIITIFYMTYDLW